MCVYSVRETKKTIHHLDAPTAAVNFLFNVSENTLKIYKILSGETKFHCDL